MLYQQNYIILRELHYITIIELCYFNRKYYVNELFYINGTTLHECSYVTLLELLYINEIMLTELDMLN